MAILETFGNNLFFFHAHTHYLAHHSQRQILDKEGWNRIQIPIFKGDLAQLHCADILNQFKRLCLASNVYARQTHVLVPYVL